MYLAENVKVTSKNLEFEFDLLDFNLPVDLVGALCSQDCCLPLDF